MRCIRINSGQLLRLIVPSLAAVWFLAGCATGPLARSPAGPVYQPNNVYRASARMPPQIRRVAVLPMSVEANEWQADAGRTQMQRVLNEELGKARTFELVLVSPEQLAGWTGRTSWRAEEKLPPDFLERLQEALACDAVLFCHLRPYHAYQPLVIGWNFKLVDGRFRSIVWSADEVFDASEVAVANAARKYCQGRAEAARSWADAESVLMSPRRFGQYTLSALLTTLPER